MSEAPHTQTEPTFEQSLQELEAVVAELETGEIGLEESMKRFERGMKLAAACEKKLGTMKRRIEILLDPARQATDSAEWNPFKEEVPAS